MMSDKGCTCYDETTRKCPIKGHPEGPQRLKVYMVQNQHGNYYRRRNYSMGGQWTDDPQRATVWTSPEQGPSYVLNMYPKAKRIDLEVELP